MKEELLKGLTDEQIAKVKACKNQEEILKVAAEEGIELNEEQLEAVSGGSCSEDSDPITCPKCGSADVTYFPIKGRPGKFQCNSCRNVFTRN